MCPLLRGWVQKVIAYHNNLGCFASRYPSLVLILLSRCIWESCERKGVISDLIGDWWLMPNSICSLEAFIRDGTLLCKLAER